METPYPKEKEKTDIFNKVTKENENYTVTIKITEENILSLSIYFENNKKKIYKNSKSYEEIKKQTYFEDYSLQEIYDELVELISKDKIEYEKRNDSIIYNVILPSKKRKRYGGYE